MLIVDSQNLPRLEAGGKIEAQEDRLTRWIQEQTANAIYLKDTDLSPANIYRQMGQKLSARELEQKLIKLEPNFQFEVVPFNATKKRLWHLRRDEGRVLVCLYENGIMPEHSFMRQKEEVVRDMSVKHINRKDLPRHEFVPGEGIKWDGLPVGFKKEIIPWGEYIRGWRTVLIRAVEGGALTPTQVENAFGADNRPEWASHLGKQTHNLPW